MGYLRTLNELTIGNKTFKLLSVVKKKKKIKICLILFSAELKEKKIFMKPLYNLLNSSVKVQYIFLVSAIYNNVNVFHFS